MCVNVIVCLIVRMFVNVCGLLSMQPGCVSFGASVVPSLLVPLIVQQCDRYKGNMAHGKRDY